jgi:hypothetical protein
MAYLDAIQEQVQRNMNAGLNKPDSQYDQEYIEALIDQYREHTFITTYNGSRELAANPTVDGMWLLNITLQYDPVAQDANANYVKFLCPDVIRINKDINGFQSVGNQGVKFSQILFADDINSTLLLDNENAYFFHDGTWLRIYNNLDIKEVPILAIFRKPLSVPGFNPELQEYPMPDGLIPLMIELMKKRELNQESQTPVDNRPDENPIPKAAK